MEAFTLLPDPQTNGGLLVSVKEDALEAVREILKKEKLPSVIDPVGRMVQKNEKIIFVKP